MTIKRVENACILRGFRFSGKKRWLNNMVGYGYEVTYPTGGWFQSDTLEGIYKHIMKYPKVKYYV